MMERFTLYQDATDKLQNKWRWRLLDGAGNEVVKSNKNFDTKDAAKQDIINLRAFVQTASIEES